MAGLSAEQYMAGKPIRRQLVSRQQSGTTGQANRAVNFLNFLRQMEKYQKQGAEPTQATPQAPVDPTAQYREQSAEAQKSRLAKLEAEAEAEDARGSGEYQQEGLPDFEDLDPNVQAAVDVLGPEITQDLLTQGYDSATLGGLTSAMAKYSGAGLDQALRAGAGSFAGGVANPQAVAELFNKATGYGINVRDLAKDIGTAMQGQTQDIGEDQGAPLDAGSTRGFVRGAANKAGLQGTVGPEGQAYGGSLAAKGMESDLDEQSLVDMVNEGWISFDQLGPETQQIVLAANKSAGAPRTGLGHLGQYVGDVARGYGYEDIQSDLGGASMGPDAATKGEIREQIVPAAKELAASGFPLSALPDDDPYKKLAQRFGGGEMDYNQLSGRAVGDLYTGEAAEPMEATAEDLTTPGSLMKSLETPTGAPGMGDPSMGAPSQGAWQTFKGGLAPTPQGMDEGSQYAGQQGINWDQSPSQATERGRMGSGGGGGVTGFGGTGSQDVGREGERSEGESSPGEMAGEGGSGEGCIIVTACTNPNSYEVNITRKFRDKCMTDEDLSGYYAIAHKVVPYLHKHEGFKDFVKEYLVDRLVDYGKVYFKRTARYEYKTSKLITKAFLVMCKIAGKLTHNTEKLLAAHRG